MPIATVFWAAFAATYVIVFIIDMYVTSRRGAVPSTKAALGWTALWIGVALAYGVAIYLFYPQNPGSPDRTASAMSFKFIAGYLTEYSLSIDNLFVFIMIFSLMGVAPRNQPRLLKLGILLSIALRVVFILVGMELVERFHWIMYGFGAILLWTAWKMAFTDSEDQVDPKANPLYRVASRLFPIDPDHDNPRFFSRKGGQVFATFVFLVFLVIGSTDVLFALDSIPAIIGVVSEGGAAVLTAGQADFVAITSNIFAVMGLVSLFFALKTVMDRFWALQYGVSFILAFIAFKMLLSGIPAVAGFFRADAWVSLAVIGASLGLSILVSNIVKREGGQSSPEAEAD
jgi:tellurite resistance protein TerC